MDHRIKLYIEKTGILLAVYLLLKYLLPLVFPFFLYGTACIFRHFSFFIILHSFAFFPAKGQIFSLYIRISDPLTSSATPGSPAFALFWQYR